MDRQARTLGDIGRIVGYIAEDNPVAARMVAREVLLAGDSLDLFPWRGREGRVAGTREARHSAARVGRGVALRGGLSGQRGGRRDGGAGLAWGAGAGVILRAGLERRRRSTP